MYTRGFLVFTDSAGGEMSRAGLSDSKSESAGHLEARTGMHNSCLLQGPGKKWEHYDLNKNGKPLRLPMHVQRGDLVQIISGAEKGKTGKVTNVSFCLLPLSCLRLGICIMRVDLAVLQVITKTGQIVVEGANIKVCLYLPSGIYINWLVW